MSHDLERVLPGDESHLQKTVLYRVITAYSRAMRVAQVSFSTVKVCTFLVTCDSVPARPAAGTSMPFVLVRSVVPLNLVGQQHAHSFGDAGEVPRVSVLPERQAAGTLRCCASELPSASGRNRPTVGPWLWGRL